MSGVRVCVIATAATLMLVDAAAAGPCSQKIATIDTQNNRMAFAVRMVALAPASRWQYANRHAAQSLLEEAKRLDRSGDPQCEIVLFWRAHIPLN
jgi:hypothetical protein